MKNKFFLEKSILIFFILVIGILLRVSYNYTQIDNIVENEVDRLSKQIDLLLVDHIKHINDKYRVVANNYQNNEKFINLVKHKNTKKLYTELIDSYNSMLIFDPYLHIMHLHDTNTVSILRMHKPESYGDDLTNIRPMIRDVNKNKMHYNGFEVGKNGINYRVSIPLFAKKKEHIGVLEFGIEPSYFISEITNIVNVESQLMIKSESMKKLIKKRDYKKLGEYSIIKTTPIYEKINPLIDLNKKNQLIKIDGRNYVVFNSAVLKNYKGITKARIIFTKDITSIVKKYNDSLFMIYGINFIIIIIIIFLFLRGIKKRNYLENSLKELNITLEDKVRKRTKEQNILLSLFDKGDSVLFKWKNDQYWSVEFASLGVTELLGYSFSDIISNKITYASCIHKDDLEQVMSEVTEASRSKESYFKHKPYRIITKSGDVKWVLDSTIIVTDGDDIKFYIGHINDITKLVNIEKQLLQHSKMVQMGEMISMIAHQWRQPLGAISAISIDLNMKMELDILDLTKKDNTENSQSHLSKSLKKIDSLVHSLTTTIDDFRNFYKSNNKKELVSINEPLNKAYSILEGSFKANSIKVNGEYLSKEKLNICINELMQVVLNILQNSQDNFLDEDILDAQINIKTYDTKISSVIEILDNGGGIKEDIIDKVFDPYFSTKNEKNGTGLGLYMSKMIVEEHHNGIITIENSVDGALFKIELFN